MKDYIRAIFIILKLFIFDLPKQIIKNHLNRNKIAPNRKNPLKLKDPWEHFLKYCDEATIYVPSIGESRTYYVYNPNISGRYTDKKTRIRILNTPLTKLKGERLLIKKIYTSGGGFTYSKHGYIFLNPWIKTPRKEVILYHEIGHSVYKKEYPDTPPTMGNKRKEEVFADRFAFKQGRIYLKAHLRFILGLDYLKKDKIVLFALMFKHAILKRYDRIFVAILVYLGLKTP